MQAPPKVQVHRTSLHTAELLPPVADTGLQVAGKPVRTVGPDLSPDTTAAESMQPLAPEVCLSVILRKPLSYSAVRFAQLGLFLAVALLAPPLPAQTPTPATVAGAPSTAAAIPAGPIAIVPLDAKNPSDSATVTGALEVTGDKAIIAASGTVTSGSATTDVVLPRRGVLHVCASTTVKLAADSSVPAGDVPGLMMAMDQGAIEASFATGRNSDILLTPDFRILIGGPGAADVKVRLGQHGDTCVDNPGINAPYVLVTSVFDGSIYRVQPGQRVMFQHGSLQEVVDHEKEPCGCPPPPHPGSNEFPLAQSAGFAPLAPPAPVPATHGTAQAQVSEPLVYKSAEPAPQPAVQAAPTPAAAAGAAPVAKPPATKKKHGFFGRIGGFLRRIFGAE